MKGVNNMKKKILYIVGTLIVFFIGVGLGGSGSSSNTASTAQTKTVYVTQAPKVVTVTKNSDVANLADWKQLKAIDDKGFNDAGAAMSVVPTFANTCADMVTAAANQDATTLQSDTQSLQPLETTESNAATALKADDANRKAILSKLGY